MHAFVQSTALGFLKIMIGNIGKKKLGVFELPPGSFINVVNQIVQDVQVVSYTTWLVFTVLIMHGKL